MSSNTNAEPKITPVPKSELLLDVASEATILRSSEGISMVVIPNHPTKKKPVSLLDSFDFVCWLTWRCHVKHGFLPSSALINTVLRALAGKALFDPQTAVVEIPQRPLRAPQVVDLQPFTPQLTMVDGKITRCVSEKSLVSRNVTPGSC